MAKRLAFIMAGGSGQRFWPVSTNERPKQFLKLASPDATLLEQSVERAASIVGLECTHIATGKPLQATSQSACSNLKPEQVTAEPHKRNTSGCLIWVAANVIAQNPTDWADTTIAVLTADQRIDPEAEFTKTVLNAMETAEEHGAIVTIGIRPDRPETGYGYIEVGDANGKAFDVIRFREKPDRDTAEQFISAGNFLWNSGMFFYTLATFMAEMELAQPEMARITREIAGHLSQGDTEAAENAFAELPSISIDFALMEKARKVMVVEATFTWDDLGAWDSIERTYPADNSGNVALGKSRAIEANNNVVYVDRSDAEVCLLGVDDLVVVVTPEAVLVCPKDRAQEVKKFLE
ncbi:MAG: mannose-1-phosphate guanylyltransferase [Armatimonadetes bacterium]|nr:mannose-1-phosphate guanylyltransferase [Armatimonadota bacterium]